MRRTRLPALVASVFLLCQAPLQVRLALALTGEARGQEEKEGSLRVGLPPPLPLDSRPDVAAVPLASLLRGGLAWGLPRRRRLAQRNPGRRPRRLDSPPLSIDLTFHLLRQMMEISRAQSQQDQAERNRLLLDSVGK